MKLKFMTPRQASKDQHRLKEKIEKEATKTTKGRENEEKKGTIGRDDGKFICQCFFFWSL